MVAERAQRAANKKNDFINLTAHALQCSQHKQIKKRTANAHNTTEQRNTLQIQLFMFLVSIYSTCCQTDADVFLICWCFFFLHVISEALSATIYTR